MSSVLPGPLAEQVRKTMDWMQKRPKDEKYPGAPSTVAEACVSQRKLKIVYRTLDAEKAMIISSGDHSKAYLNWQGG